jgi:hypothetical protein
MAGALRRQCREVARQQRLIAGAGFVLERQ